MNWYLEKKNKKIKCVKISIMNINQWCELFVTYNSDLTCVGYEILSGEFIYLENRFENILIDVKHEFCNILNLDTENIRLVPSPIFISKNLFFDENILFNERLKYIFRYFNTYIINKNLIPILPEKKISHFYGIKKSFIHEYNLPYETDALFLHNPNGKLKLFGVMWDEFMADQKICFSSSVFDLFDNYDYIPPIKYMSVFMVDINDKNLSLVKNYLNQPYNIIIKRGYLLSFKKDYFFSTIILKNKISNKSHCFQDIINNEDLFFKDFFYYIKNFKNNKNKYKFKFKFIKNNFPTLYQLCCMKMNLYIDNGVINKIKSFNYFNFSITNQS